MFPNSETSPPSSPDGRIGSCSAFTGGTIVGGAGVDCDVVASPVTVCAEHAVRLPAAAAAAVASAAGSGADTAVGSGDESESEASSSIVVELMIALAVNICLFAGGSISSILINR